MSGIFISVVPLKRNCIFRRQAPDGGSYIIKGATLKMTSKALMGPLGLVSEMVVLRKMKHDPSASSGFPIILAPLAQSIVI